MSIGDIMGDALAYPFHNIKALVIYVVLGIIGAVIGGASLLSIVMAFSSKGLAGTAFGGLSIIGVVIFVLILFLIEGYALDIIKYGIERRDDGPGIDMQRQIANAAKLIVVDIVYYIIPVIIVFILGFFLKNWILSIIALVLFIVFALAHFMAKCKLAKTDDLGEALAIGEAIDDISRVGIGKILGVVVLFAIILIVIAFVIAYISGLHKTVGSLLLGIASVYFVFFYNRAIGLLYSD